ncbi:hypothetical protein BDV19DRAFT_374123 [Aspergillus venezuelensis]
MTLAGEQEMLAYLEHTPMLPVTKMYHGVHRKEFLLLMCRLEDHFLEWAEYYANDANKIAEATRHLSEEIAVKWALNRLSLSDRIHG